MLQLCYVLQMAFSVLFNSSNHVLSHIQHFTDLLKQFYNA